MQKEKYQNFVCGWGAGFIETLLLYPQNKMIFRQQLQGITAKEVFRQLRNEGYWMLYRGILPPLIQRTTTRSVMFGMFDKFHRYFGCLECHAPQTRITCFACAAFMAGAVEAISCPLERTQVLLQSPRYNQCYQNTIQAFSELAKIGPKELYRGFTVILLRNGLSNVLFFTLRKPFRDLVIDYDQQCVSDNINDKLPEQLVTFVGDFISGAVLGASISSLFFPLNVVKQRIQSTVNTPFLSAWKTFQIIWVERNGSLKELFRGITLNYTSDDKLVRVSDKSMTLSHPSILSHEDQKPDSDVVNSNSFCG
uniref:Mitochondrial carrier protein n=1 Tax=Setaria digitata TaxID=48799 RepID=A0A915Q7E1_9BILA